ncbi:polyprenyl synthetase family protein [Nonomuraea sp. NPDC050451]|uniref:polyprenyl synthetase family protein n=1 Tax=Nonomuraea sp. NPDC050451 TaxID=3364364 RepID=UPI0037B690EA
MLELCAGQAADLAFETRQDVGLPECLAMAEAKTGALLGAACQLGALAAGAEPAAAHCYRTFARQLGVAFQLVDDLLGVWGDPIATGKPAGSDLASRKKSLPVVAALTSGTAAGECLARMYQREQDMDEHAIAHAAELIEAAGGKTWAQQEAERRIVAALDALTAAHPDPAATTDLHALAALITRRDR